MKADTPIIAIDGPSGSGKGTISRAVAHALGWRYLDSGALYRLVALAGLGRGLDSRNRSAHAQLADDLDAEFSVDAAGEEHVLLEGEEVGHELRTEQCGNAASRVALYPEVRAGLTRLQHKLAKSPGLVADGRDMGSVVFPHAGLKIFLTASPAERARRRHKQLKEKGIDVSLAALSAEIAERDARDAARKVAPLKPAENAVILDTTDMSIDEVVRQVLALARQCFGDVTSRGSS